MGKILKIAQENAGKLLTSSIDIRPRSAIDSAFAS